MVRLSDPRQGQRGLQGHRRLTKALNAAHVETRPIIAGNIARQPALKLYEHRVVGDMKHSNAVMDGAFSFGNHQDVDSGARSVCCRAGARLPALARAGLSHDHHAAPFRVLSFFGGGTDYVRRAWFREHGGAALACLIDKYLSLHVRYLPPFFDFKSRIVWSQIEQVQSAAEIKHPAIRGVLEWMKIHEGVEIRNPITAILPARTGLGSSSSFTVGLLHALHAMRGELVSKRALAEEAIYVEQTVLKENVGIQDQISSAFGGLNRVDIRPDASFEVVPLVVQAERLASLQDHLLLIYTGLSRHASEIAAEQVSTMGSKTVEMKAMRAMVDDGEKILAGTGTLRDFGRLLDEAWQRKRSLSSKIAPTMVNEMYDAARKAGADGGKLLGAGGGGFMLIFVEPAKRAAVLRALDKLLPVPFKFERGGTQLVLYEAEQQDGRRAGD